MLSRLDMNLNVKSRKTRAVVHTKTKSLVEETRVLRRRLFFDRIMIKAWWRRMKRSCETKWTIKPS